jgi:hypothetical protein
VAILRRRRTFEKTYRLGDWAVHVHERHGRFLKKSKIEITRGRGSTTLVWITTRR